MIFEEEADKGTEETTSLERIGMVNDKVTVMGDFRGPKLHLLGVSDQIMMAEGVKPLGDCLGTTARRVCCSDDTYSHEIRVTHKVKI